MAVGEIEIRADQFQAFAGGQSVDLTRREFELIQLLAEAEGQVLQREEIYERVWGYAMVHGDRSVDVFVRKLRQKLERASPGWRYIHTHFGIGYRFAPEPVVVEADVGGRGRRSVEPAAAEADGRGAGRHARLTAGRTIVGAVGPDTGKHLRNIAIIVVLAVAVWKLPGGGAASLTISNLLTIVFVGGLLFFGYRMYMEHRETIFGLPERQRGILYAAIALATITIVATRRMWDEGGPRRDALARLPGARRSGRVFSVWRAYREY